MTTPRTGSKVLLLSSPRAVAGNPAAVPLRRFRIARLRLDGTRTTGDARLTQLKAG